jgi:hypothetical protein
MTDFGSTSGTVGRLNIAGSADTSTNTLLQFNKGAFGTSEFTQFYTSGSNYGLGLNSLLYVNKGSGNVGIGETSPGSKLSVSGGGSFGAGYDTTAAPMKGLNGHSSSQLAGTPLRPPRYGSRSPTRSVVWGPCPPVGPLAQAFQSTTSQLFASLTSRPGRLSWPVPIVTAEASAPAIPPIFITAVPRLLHVPMAIGTIASKVHRPRFGCLKHGQRDHRGGRSHNERTSDHFSSSVDFRDRNVPLPYLTCTPAE